MEGTGLWGQGDLAVSSWPSFLTFLALWSLSVNYRLVSLDSTIKENNILRSVWDSRHLTRVSFFFPRPVCVWFSPLSSLVLTD